MGVSDADVETSSVVSMLNFWEEHVVLSVHDTEAGVPDTALNSRLFVFT